MTLAFALAFLRQHQPLKAPVSADNLAMMRQVTAYFFANPHKSCIPLLLNAFGDWEDDTLCESIQFIIQRFNHQDVVPHLESALQSEHQSVVFWAADTSRFFPDTSLLPALTPLLEIDDQNTRMVAAVAIENIARQQGELAANRILSDDTKDKLTSILKKLDI